MKISILLLEFVRVLSGVANVASEYGCSNPCRFREMTFFGFLRNYEKKLRCRKIPKRFLGFLQTFSENLDIKVFTKFEITISVVRLSG